MGPQKVLITTPAQSKPGSNGNEEALYMSQDSRTGASWLDSLVSYLVHSLRKGVISFAEMQQTGLRYYGGRGGRVRGNDV